MTTAALPFLSRALALLVALLGPSLLQAQALVSLGTLGGTESSAAAINDRGEVVGFSSLADDPSRRAFLYTGGTMQNIGGLSAGPSTASGINNLGQVTGSAGLPGGSYAFRYDGADLIDLGALGNNNNSSGGAGINDAGHVIGTSTILEGYPSHPFLHDGVTMTDLGSLGFDYSIATAINNSDLVVGWSLLVVDGFWAAHAFLHDGSTLQDLGTLGGQNSWAYALNDAGQVAGESLTWDLYNHAFLYGNGTMTDLGTLGGDYSRAIGINNAGQVVGESSTGAGAPGSIFWYDGSVMHDLNLLYGSLLSDGTTPGFTRLDGVADINNAGQIAGNGTYFDGTGSFSRGFVLDTRAAVPETPATLSLLGLTLAGLIAIRRRIART